MQAPSLHNLDLEDTPPVKGKGPLSSVMGSLGWPIMVGLVGFWTFLFLVQNDFITNELLVRYLTAHPVSYVATAMFFVGMAGLTLKLMGVLYQIADQKNIVLSPLQALPQRANGSRRLLDELDEMTPSQQSSYMGTRLRDALEFVDKTESANGLDDELKYLSDLDAGRQQESYSLTRILIWAIPMLGFLGTVVGISGALGSLSVASDFEIMLAGLRDKLYVAFDTTALALTLSIVLMFVQFIVNRIETQYLSAVDDAAADQLIGRFETFGTNRDPYLASVENMSRQVLGGMADISQQQAQAWQSGLDQVRDTTAGVLDRFAEVMASRLAEHLDPIMDEMGSSVRNAVADSQHIMDNHAKKLQQAMEDSVGLIEARNLRLVELMGKQSLGFEELLESQSKVLKGAIDHSDNVVAGHMVKLDHSLEKSLHVMENANIFMENQSEKLHEVVTVSSKMMEQHARKISDAVTRSEEIVDKRQETIAQTQESMLRAQTQQSMAISQFTERLEVLQETVDQARSLEQMQVTLQQTIEDLSHSDSLIHEIKGMSKVIKEQVTKSDLRHQDSAEAITSQARKSMEQIQSYFEENAKTLSEYQVRQEQLITSVLEAKLSLDTDNIVNSLDNHSATTSQSIRVIENNFELLGEQIHAKFQSLDELGRDLSRSINLESPVADLKNALTFGLEQIHQAVSNQGDSQAVEDKLKEIQVALQAPTPHQQQFLEQQRQTIENQTDLLDFCQTIEVNNRSAFLESSKQILTQHAEAASKAVQLEETVRELAFSVNLLNQSLTKHANDAAVSTMKFREPDIPKRVG